MYWISGLHLFEHGSGLAKFISRSDSEWQSPPPLTLGAPPRRRRSSLRRDRWALRGSRSGTRSCRAYVIEDSAGIELLLQACSAADRVAELSEAISREVRPSARRAAEGPPALRDELHGRAFMSSSSSGWASISRRSSPLEVFLKGGGRADADKAPAITRAFSATFPAPSVDPVRPARGHADRDTQEFGTRATSWPGCSTS